MDSPQNTDGHILHINVLHACDEKVNGLVAVPHVKPGSLRPWDLDA